MKIILVGRPGAITERQDVVLTTMQNSQSPGLPKSLPAPPDQPTIYTVYIPAKQWRKVARALQDETDTLVVEGWAAYDPALAGIAVWATSCTTKALQRAKREEEQQKQQA